MTSTMNTTLPSLIFLLCALSCLAAAADRPKNPAKPSVSLAYGISAAAGISGIIGLILALLWLRRRQRRKMAQKALIGDSELWCQCKECSGCKKREGGGNGTATCDECRRTCGA
jgi:hypothetical protein